MDQMEKLWAYMEEDIKADRIDSELRNSPARQSLEKLRAFIKERQNAYNAIDETIAVMADRKDAISDAISRAETTLSALIERANENPPETVEDTQLLIDEIEKCRRTVLSYEQELRKMSSESTEFDARKRTIRREAARAKQDFDQARAAYNAESQTKKEAYTAQRQAADAKAVGIPAELLARYGAVKRQITPPLARLTGGKCSGCNTSQPSAALRKIELGQEIVSCETCGRILIKS
ncbi:MAG: hypothetical protein IKP40_07965 [Clostridia bacterium]|nr:hypothetical protein [Clostridia bacterium]